MREIQVNHSGGSFKIRLDPAQHVHRTMLEALDKGSTYEPESDFISKRITPHDFFLDCGAHIGYYSLCAAATGATVRSFEPHPDNFRMLLENIELNGFRNMIPLHAAVGSDYGPVELCCNLDNDGGHGLWDVTKHPLHQKTREQDRKFVKVWKTAIGMEIPYAPLIHNRDSRLWIKADVEGCEYDIVRGVFTAIENIAVMPLPIFILEINRFCLEQMGSSEFHLRQVLYARGYKSYAHSECKLIHIADDQYIKGKVANMVFWPPQLEPLKPEA